MPNIFCTGGPEGVTATFNRMQDLIYRAKDQPITGADLVPLEEFMTTSEVAKAFATMMRGLIWRAPSDDRGGTPKPEGAPLTSPTSNNGDGFPSKYTPLNTPEEVQQAIDTSRDKMRLYVSQGHSLLYLLLRFVAPHLLLALGAGLIRSCALVLQVWALWTVVRCVNGDPDYDYPLGVQFVVAAMLPIGAYLQSLSQHTTFHVSTRAGLLMRSAAIAIVFEKLRVLTPLAMGAAVKEEGDDEEDALAAAAATTKLSHEPISEEVEVKATTTSDATTKTPASASRPSSPKPAGSSSSASAPTSSTSAGQLINFVSSDANTIIEAITMGPIACASILDLCICIAWIGWIVGWPAAPLAGAIILIILFQMWCGHHISGNKSAVAAVGDQRLRSLTEFLSGIQVVKFYAWEVNVTKMITGLRKLEASLHIHGNVWKLISLATIFFAGGIFSVVIFACKLSFDETMEPAQTFVIMALVSNTSRGFEMLPRAITCAGTCIASMARVEEYLKRNVTKGLPAPVSGAEEQQSNGVSDETEMQPATAADDRPLVLRGDFGWSGFALRSLDLTCPNGSLTVILGKVGSGKSTLLQAALGVCATLSPDYTVQLPGKGTIAYVAQEAFIQDATVRENVVFGKPFDEAKYRQVIKACSLVTDLQQWGGDLVEVTGGTLSGGQRQRISLARACYADADLYIVDDPISAVDASVGRHLLKHCFRGYLKGKTVLLATHHPAPARFADQVVMMLEGGRVRCRAVTDAAILHQLEGANGKGAAELVSLGDANGVGSGAFSAAFHSLEEEVGKDDPLAADDIMDDDDDEADGAGGGEDCISENGVDPRDAILDEHIGKSRQLRHVEVEAPGAVSWAVYKTYFKGGGCGLAILSFSLFVLAQAARTAQDWWFSAWTRRMYPNLSNDQSLYILGILVAAMIVLSFSRTVIFGNFTIAASSNLHDRMFNAVIASPLHFFEQVPLGRIMNRFSKDLDYCDDLLPRTMYESTQLLLMITGSLALLVYSVPWFAIAIPIALVVFAFLIKTYMPASRYIKRIEGTSRSPTMNAFQTVISGLTTIRVYDRLDYFQDIFFSTADVTSNTMLHSNCTQRWMGVRMDWVSAFWVLCAAFLAVGLQDELGPSLVGLCLSQSLSFTSLLQFSIRMAAETENLMTAAERLDEYSHLPPEENKGTVTVAPATTHDGETTAVVAVPANDKHTVLPASWPENCDILAKGLTVAYHSNPDVPVLKNLHFTIKAGQRVAVVGRTGAGKSSLLSAFYRTVAIPDGSLTIGGTSTTDMDVFALRPKLGIIPQVPTLFHGTFRYNLDPFDLYTDEALMEALEKVHLDAYVLQREGLDTMVGDGGGNLSVGQRQLLCAARVLLTGASILFMDEATANIDEETDEQIQRIVREEAARRQMTIITIAHRLNTIMDYDLVLVLSQGRLVEYGNPRELVAAGSAEELDEAKLTTTDHGDFTTDVRSFDEVRQFARMVETMVSAHNEHH